MVGHCKHFEYLGFDDRKIMLISIPVFALFVPVLFENIPFYTYIQNPFKEYCEGLFYTASLWLGIRYVIIYLRKKMPQLHQTMMRISIMAVSAVITTFFIFYICKYCILGMESCFGLDSPYGSDHRSKAFVYLMTLALMIKYEAIYFFNRYKKAIQEKEQLQTAHVQAQLDNLRNQINPHFLFNSLNTLMNLIPKDQDRAMSYLEKLSKFYRYSVGKKDDTSINIETEIANAKIYADLLHERFGSNIQIEFRNHVPKDTQILPMTLQLLIENAVKHNVVSKNSPLQIEVETKKDGEYIMVKNNLRKKIQAVSSTGMGLDNIKKRFAYFTKKPVLINENPDSFQVLIPLLKSQ